MSPRMSPLTNLLAAAAPPRAGGAPCWMSSLFLRIARFSSRARRPGTDSALPHANRLPYACPGFTSMTKQEGTHGPRPCFINQCHASPQAPPTAWARRPFDLIFTSIRSDAALLVYPPANLVQQLSLHAADSSKLPVTCRPSRCSFYSVLQRRDHCWLLGPSSQAAHSAPRSLL
jgi:hypothetical protein